MKKLLLIFLFLLGVAVLATIAGILMGGRGAPWARARRSSSGASPDRCWSRRAPRLPFGDAAAPVSIAELYPALRAARQDSGVRGLAVYIQEADLGLAKAQELRRQMMALRRAGKFVECYLETAGRGIERHPRLLPGDRLREDLSRARRRPQPARALLREPVPARRARQAQDRPRASTASAATRAPSSPTPQNQYSPEAEEAIAAVLDGYFAQIVSAIAEARHKSDAEVRALIDGAP